MQRDVEYTITKGNENKKFQLIKKYGVWALHFKRRLKRSGTFDLTIHGKPADLEDKVSDLYEKPLTLRIKLNVIE